MKEIDERQEGVPAIFFVVTKPALQVALADGSTTRLDRRLMTTEEYAESVGDDNWKVEQCARVLNSMLDDIAGSRLHCAATTAVIKATVKVSKPRAISSKDSITFRASFSVLTRVRL